MATSLRRGEHKMTQRRRKSFILFFNFEIRIYPACVRRGGPCYLLGRDKRLGAHTRITRRDIATRMLRNRRGV